MGFAHQGAERIFATHFAKIEVSLPSKRVVLSIKVEELKRHNLGESVIDVIEWAFEDMGLGEPAMAFRHILAAFVACSLMWEVLLF